MPALSPEYTFNICGDTVSTADRIQQMPQVKLAAIQALPIVRQREPAATLNDVTRSLALVLHDIFIDINKGNKQGLVRASGSTGTDWLVSYYGSSMCIAVVVSAFGYAPGQPLPDVRVSMKRAPKRHGKR